MNYKLINNVAGWLTFLVATVTYLMTMEASASFWDCGEFITTAYKLEVGHPPGAPFFMILGRFFTLFAGGNVELVATMINTLSALSSSFTILFLFWSITHIAKRVILNGENKELSQGQLIAVLGSGIIGALAYTFSDSFWFSAVEGEVYAMSSFFTAVVFWAILKWEAVFDEKYANRWLILIAYLMGLSIGVHLLNLLAIPAIVYIYYFKRYEITRKGVILAGLLSVAILGFTMIGIIQGTVIVASWFELLFTNSFGLPFNTGSIIFFILLVGGLVYGIYFSLQKKKAILNTVLTAALVVLIGYSSFAIILIRSQADTPMNQNAPDNVFALLSFLNREQYGDRPLAKGQYFNAPVTKYGEGKATYIQKDGKYVIVDHATTREFDSRFTTLFPRMYSDSKSPNHVQGYQQWTGTSDEDFYEPQLDPETKQPVTNRYGEVQYDYYSPTEPPTFGQNVAYFVKYQLNFMYIRYFMWNFAGRQSDAQTHGSVQDGNWLSGIGFIDEMRLGNQDKITSAMKNNKGRNTYYFLPLILGIIGMIYLFKANKTSKNYFWVVLLFFFFTGIAIVLYLNQPPFQPRERDYAYSGSFYVFSIFIGFGVAGIYELLRKKMELAMSAGVAILLSIPVPAILAQQNWDDHDRSERFTASDYAKNYLNSCEENAIIFTNGDNDTFPLWYIQEVEGYRTDVRVINLSYLNTDWYIDQMQKQAYLSKPVPFSLVHDQYGPGTREIVYRNENPNVYLAEKYEANKATLEPEYKTMFDNYFAFLTAADIETKDKNAFDILSKGHTALSPEQFYGFAKKLEEPANITKFGIDGAIAKKYAKDAEALLIKITKASLPIKTLMKHISSDNGNLKVQMRAEDPPVNYMPTDFLHIPASKERLKETNTLRDGDLDKALPAINWDLNKSYIRKNELMVLDLLAHNDWERPVYFAITVGGSSYMNLENYFQLEGLAYRVVPIKSGKSNSGDKGRVNTDILYDNMMNKFVWGGIEKNAETIYLDENNRRFLLNYKNSFTRLADQLIVEKKNEKAEAVLDRCTSLFPNELNPFGYYDMLIAKSYYGIAKKEKANSIMKTSINNLEEDFMYYLSLSPRHLNTVVDDFGRTTALTQEALRILSANGEKEQAAAVAAEVIQILDTKYAGFEQRIIQLQADEQQFYAWYGSLRGTDQNIAQLYLTLMEYKL